ncbi:MAG: hypothetical protein HY649_00420 [Acidobacteria bacterium]|nr:hypothetical protein [Acidobacteriota bacterium]
MKRMQTTLIRGLWLSLLSTVFFVNPIAYSDGGHGDDQEEQKVVAPNRQMNVKIADSDSIEALIKYPTPKPAEGIPLLIFLTDTSTNTPIGGAHLSLAISPARSGQPPEGAGRDAAAQTIAVTASPTDTPGIYETKITFPDSGDYNLTLKLEGENQVQVVNLSGIVVPGAGEAAEREGMGWRNRLPLGVGAVASFILAGVLSYLFWVRPRKRGRTAESIASYTSVEGD